MSSIQLTVELDADQAAALFRLCDKFSHSDAQQYLYPHLPKDLRSEQASQMMSATYRVLAALKDAGIESAWPWIDTGITDADVP